MNQLPLEKWTRFALATMAFAMALLLTPRALLEVTGPVDSHEIPVDMLEPSDECLWCDSPVEFDEPDCDIGQDLERHWLNPDEISPESLGNPCRDEIAAKEPSA